MLLEFEVQDMTCVHCVKTITEAVQRAIPGAAVTADTATHRVRVQTEADATKVEAAIREAGYTPKVC